MNKINYKILGGSLPKIYRHRNSLYNAVLSHLAYIDNPQGLLWGGISCNEEEFLANAIGKANLLDGPIIEIGTLFGCSTQLIADIKNNDKELHTVDNFSWNPFGMPQEHHEQLTRRNLRYLISHCRTHIHSMSSDAFFLTYKGAPPSLVFIDGSHEENSVKNDIEGALRIGAKIICGHDYAENWPGVVNAVRKCLGTKIETGESIWLWQSSHNVMTD